MRAVSLLLSSRNLLMLVSSNVSPTIDRSTHNVVESCNSSVETVGALLMLSHWWVGRGITAGQWEVNAQSCIWR